jgi:16S rRNA (adenine1518-N6/adenine1519-N6)-dimethyltransferase
MTSPRTLLGAWNIHPKKQLGQNFLIEPSIATMIVARSGILAEDIVLEIGAGLGALTIPMAGVAQTVYAVEKDHQLIDLLKTELLTHNVDNVNIIENDILHFDVKALTENHHREIIVVGNLPYNISSQILVQLINSRETVSKAILMLQKELARRLTAKPNCKDYSRLTVMLRYCADIQSLLTVDAAFFFPKPKINSEVLEIKFKNKQEDRATDEKFLFGVIKASFGRRRKTLKNALAGSELKIGADTALQALDFAGIDPIRRAETLEVSEFVKLSNCLGDILQSEQHI